MTKQAFKAVLLCMAFALSAIVHADQVAQEHYSLSAQNRYVIGGILGTIVGLGVGHAIERRYFDQGLIFSVSEGLSILLIIIGTTVPMPNGASIPLTLIGGFTLGAFKLWEIVDIWSGPFPNNGTPRPNDASRLSLLDAHLSQPTYQMGMTIHF